MAEISIAKFNLLTNQDEKKETIQWLTKNCPFFKNLPLNFTFPKDFKIAISDKIKIRETLFFHYIRTGDACSNSGPSKEIYKNQDFYIIKKGNAFSWVNSTIKKFSIEFKCFLKDKKAKEVRSIGITPEIFCEGDIIMPWIEWLPAFSWLYEDGTGNLVRGEQNIVTGLPFEMDTSFLVLIKIQWRELERVFSRAGLEKILYSRHIQHIKFELLLNKFRLWCQWTNDSDIKILSVLHLYFLGILPLLRWRVAGIIGYWEFDERGICFKKPREQIDAFDVSPSELTFFTGLRRQTIDDHIVGNKNKKIESFFKKYPELNKVLVLKTIPGQGYRFYRTFISDYPFSEEYEDLNSVLQRITLSPPIEKYT